MRRNEKLVEISRRDFCALASCAGAALAVAGCTDGGAGVVETGGLGDHPDADEGHPAADAAPGAPDARPGSPDAAPGSPDAQPGTPDAMPGGPACTGSATDCGPASNFTVGGTPKLFSGARAFVLRDSGGLYAVSSICTHEGATNGVSSGRFRCPRHGALFNYDGSIISGPVFQPLVHYAMCILPNGNVGVTSTTVSTSTRLAV